MGDRIHGVDLKTLPNKFRTVEENYVKAKPGRALSTTYREDTTDLFGYDTMLKTKKEDEFMLSLQKKD